jgi:hypothetical protein
MTLDFGGDPFDVTVLLEVLPDVVDGRSLPRLQTSLNRVAILCLQGKIGLFWGATTPFRHARAASCVEMLRNLTICCAAISMCSNSIRSRHGRSWVDAYRGWVLLVTKPTLSGILD